MPKMTLTSTDTCIHIEDSAQKPTKTWNVVKLIQKYLNIQYVFKFKLN